MIKLKMIKAEELMELGGDWDRRNRLKIYKGLLATISRDFAKASECFLSGIATFASHELCSYEVFIFYTVVTSIIALDRVSLKKQIIDSAEVHQVVASNPGLETFLHSFYGCDYKQVCLCVLLCLC